MKIIKPMVVGTEGRVLQVTYDLSEFRETQTVFALNFWNSMGALFWRSFWRMCGGSSACHYNSSHLVWLFAARDRRPHPSSRWYFTLSEADADNPLFCCPLKRQAEDEGYIGLCVRVLPAHGLRKEIRAAALRSMSEITSYLIEEYPVCRIGTLDGFRKSLVWLDMQKMLFGLPEPPFAEAYPFDPRGFEYEIRGYGTLQAAGHVHRPPAISYKMTSPA